MMNCEKFKCAEYRLVGALCPFYNKGKCSEPYTNKEERKKMSEKEKFRWKKTEIDMDIMGMEGKKIHLKDVPAFKISETGETGVNPINVLMAELEQKYDVLDEIGVAWFKHEFPILVKRLLKKFKETEPYSKDDDKWYKENMPRTHASHKEREKFREMFKE